AAPARPREFAAPGERVDPHSGFPLPMSLAFGNALSHLGSGIGHAPDRERAGPVDPGRRSYGGADTRGDLAGDDLGPEWASLLHAWVDAHKFYPEEAAMKGEDGTAQVRVVLRRSGAVQSVDLTERSGSVFLDAALQALFRAQHLPPFPPTDPDDSATIYFTMHYILVR
ncbi:MAG TPA: TonB family protein, partial [Acetobacteraceae bacterium]|nr:TonB family protein [Acetobacteraceae bacterium]